MANLTQENTVLNKRVLASTSTDVAQCPSSKPFNPIFVHINNCGVVMVGDNNEINVDSSALSNNTELQRKSLSDLWSERVSKGDEKIGGFDFTKRNMAKISQKSRGVPRCTVELLVQEEKSAAISTFSPVVKRKQHHCACVDEERKRGNRKRRKRQGRNSNYTTSSSGEDRRDTATLNELSFENDSSSFQQALQTFHCCFKVLHPLLMKGSWTEFERLAEELLLKDDVVYNPAREIIIVLEKSLAFALWDELERAQDMMNNIVQKIEQTSGFIRLLLEVLSKCYLASVYRKRKLFGEAERCLEKGKRISSGFRPCFPVACLLYHLGSCKIEIASMFVGSRTEYSGAAEGKKLLDSCIGLSFPFDSEMCRYIQHLAVSKIAGMNLNCETSVFRKKDIKRQNIKEAEKWLGTLENEFYSRKEVELSKIHRLIAEMDLCYRLEEYHDAEEIAKETLELIETSGFKLQVTRVQERLSDIRRKITEASSNETFYRENPKIIDSCSSSLYSSEHEAFSSN